MAKPTARDWQRLANLNKHNAQMVADMRAEFLAGGKRDRGRALRIKRSIAEAARLEKELNKRDGRK